MSALERNPQLPAPTPHKVLGPSIDGRGITRGPLATRMMTGLSCGRQSVKLEQAGWKPSLHGAGLGGWSPPSFTCMLRFCDLSREGRWWLKPEPWQDRRERGRWYLAAAEVGAVLSLLSLKIRSVLGERPKWD